MADVVVVVVVAESGVVGYLCSTALESKGALFGS